MNWIEPERAVQLADRAISLASELGLPTQARALGFRGFSRAVLGDEDGVDDMLQALDAATSQGLGRETALLYFNLSEVLGVSEGARVRLETLERGLSFAQRRGIEEFVLAFCADIVATHVDLGAYDEALERARELDPRLDEARDVSDQIMVRSSEVAVFSRRGRLDKALDLSRWAIERARESENPQFLALALGSGAALQLAAQDLAAARDLLEELDRIKRLALPYAGALPHVVRTAVALGDADLARRLADNLPSKPLLRKAGLLTAQALIAEHEGRHGQAAGAFAEAAKAWERLQTPWERAHALLGQGRCLVALGRSSEASDLIRAARKVFNALGAAPALSETDALMQRASALAS
ncbi:MAG: hypothetical protein JOY58_02905 [Solirubrobacterales bacterium]|nr:hypothetical protein [Solirubrobacterales bacterium]